MILSEQTKEMSREDLEIFKNMETHEPDMMGFYGKEGVDDGSENK